MPFRSEDLPYFSKKNNQEKKDILSSLQTVVDVYQSAINSGIEISDSRSLIWHALKKLGLRPSSDLFECIHENDIVEMYNGSSQIFRSLNFYKLCSYSIEELACIHWTELYSRDMSILEEILSLLDLTLQTKKIQCADKIPYHIVKEKKSVDLLSIEYRMKYIAPLFADEGTHHYLAITKARLAKTADH